MDFSLVLYGDARQSTVATWVERTSPVLASASWSIVVLAVADGGAGGSVNLGGDSRSRATAAKVARRTGGASLSGATRQWLPSLYFFRRCEVTGELSGGIGRLPLLRAAVTASLSGTSSSVTPLRSTSPTVFFGLWRHHRWL
nr:hypothetical protein Iba_contig4724CG0010 [Ipomoea batatas]